MPNWEIWHHPKKQICGLTLESLKCLRLLNIFKGFKSICSETSLIQLLVLIIVVFDLNRQRYNHLSWNAYWWPCFATNAKLKSAPGATWCELTASQFLNFYSDHWWIWCSMMFNDVLWCSIVLIDILWCSMMSMMFCDVLWCYMMFYDVLWCFMS